jgi:hypothetical protein
VILIVTCNGKKILIGKKLVREIRQKLVREIRNKFVKELVVDV